MGKVLRKRLLRDLKSNFMRYAALVLLIVMGMYIVVSVCGAAETIITGTENKCVDNNCEDGQFTVFVPLTDDQLSQLEDKGVILEKMFSLDIEVSGNKVLRVMHTREKINLIDLDEGSLAKSNGEVVLEKRYAEENKISLGDTVEIAGESFKVTGIGSVPDYDLPVKKLSDTSASSSDFGLAFVTDQQYDDILSGTQQKAEEYTYAYTLGKKMTDEKLKQAIKDLKFDYTEVDDKYFQETIKDTVGKKDDLVNGIAELKDGSKELSDGLSELGGHNYELRKGAEEIFKYYLLQANTTVDNFGVTKVLKADNYADILDEAIKSADDETSKEALTTIKSTLDELKAYSDGVSDYTDGVRTAADGSDELYDGISELKSETDKFIDEAFDIDIANLTSFVTAADNPRILGAKGDLVLNKQVSLVAGVIVMILFTYVISVFVIHQIQRESSVIGALYALGVKKKDLVKHYMTMPTIVSFIGGVIGVIIAFTPIGISYQMEDTYAYSSIPEFTPSMPAYLIVYSLIMPPVVSVIVNLLVINKKLSRTALSLIKNEQKISTGKNIDLRGKSFVTAFRIRQMLREARTGLTVVFGMLISMLILMIAVDCYVLCDNVEKETNSDTKYQYMYSLKYPEKQVPKGGTAVYTESLSKTYLGYTLDVSVMGIEEGNKYFNCTPVKGKSKVVISRSVQQKYGISEGDKLILTDNANEMDYAFTVSGIADYSAGLAVFMDIDSMRELFGQSEDYYNTVLSDKALDIDEGRLYAVTTKQNIERSSRVFADLMMPMVVMLTIVSAIIFFTVMYLMLNVMIDRASFGISLIKIFGFRTKEIKKLYLNGNFYIITIGALICVPLSKAISDAMYPYLISNASCGMNLAFPWYLYVMIFGGVLLLYFIINSLLVRKLGKVTPAEVLKNRE
ncbi:FtsX-like permease family protein [Ruminococcus sp.]|uniref:FtsX-like permease family protein n=1 Tax=Ruminococcus sp. TaxID=41978 RepID=UPI0025FD9FF4|nr:ABC transporter permease [Ruminococcus sp.]